MPELAASRWGADFLFGFGALFAIINPYGLAFILFDRTKGLSEKGARSLPCGSPFGV